MNANTQKELQSEFDKEAQFFHETSKLNDISHWFIIIRAKTYNKNRNLNLNEIKKHTNKWENWDYPCLDPYPYNRDEPPDFDWIESRSFEMKEGHKQHWRFYRNGQFVHLRQFLESHRWTSKPDYIGIHSIICLTTKVFDFAAKTARGFKDDSAFVKIQMVNVGDLALRRHVKDTEDYRFSAKMNPSSDLIEINETAFNDYNELTSGSESELFRLARDAANSLFKYFISDLTKKPHFLDEKNLKNIQDNLKEAGSIPY